ncbi:MAG TPA: YggT family protein [Methylomirabilota bacterium]|jgi:uncharacterized protein YggT (Ycf19 family)|nr:YggT family protein [Methylomirabilota bacterium]
MAETIIHRHYTYNPIQIIARIVWTVNGVLEAFLGLRFLLRLFGANPAAGFTDFVYVVTQPFVAPFTNVFRPLTQNLSSGVWDWAPLIAIAIYSLIAWSIVQLLTLDQPEDISNDREIDRVEHIHHTT